MQEGHLDERAVSSWDCLSCKKLKQDAWRAANAETINEKSRVWYAANSEKAKVTRANWRAKNPEKVRENVATWQAANAEKFKADGAAWSKANPEKKRAYSANFRKQNPERAVEIRRLWASQNKGAINAAKSKRLAAMKQAVPAWANLIAIVRIYAEACRVTKATGIVHHVDHIVPIRSRWVCGLHCEANLRIIPGSENLTKSNRHWPDMAYIPGAA